MIKLINKDTIKDSKAKFTGSRVGTFQYKGETKQFKYNVVNGEVQTFSFSKPIGEMISSSETQDYFLKEVYLEIDLGLDAEVTLYESLYEIITDANFPETFKATWLQAGRVVFLQHIEGGEVKFGTRYAEEGDTAEILTYSAGFEYTEDMILYNQTFNMQLMNRAMGEAYNMLQNHMHFYPIINFSYTSANQTPASTVYDTPAQTEWDSYTRQVMNTRATLIDAVKHGRDENPSRNGSILVIHSTNEQLIMDALGDYKIDGTYPRSVRGIESVVAYDGASITVGEQTYTYTGIGTGVGYLVQPKKYMKSLVKHGLLVDAGNEDLSRLVEKQIVGRSRQGVYAGVERSVEEITLPS